MAREINLGSKAGKTSFAAKASEKKEQMAEKLEPEKTATEANKKAPASPTKLTINIDSASKRDFKRWCLDNDTTMSDFVLRAIDHRDQVAKIIQY